MGGAIGSATMRIYASDASMSRKDIIYGDVSSVLIALGAADPRLAQVVPYTPGAVLKEDDRLIIALKMDSGTDALDTASVLRLPVTIKNITTGIVRAAFLTYPDFVDMAGAALSGTDITILASFTDAIQYIVKPQERLILGHKFAENSRVYATFADT